MSPRCIHKLPKVLWRLRQNLASTGNLKNGTNQEGGRSTEAHGRLMVEGNLIVYGHPYLQQPLKGLVRQSGECHRESLQIACL